MPKPSETDIKILNNSRLTVVNSKHMPLVVGALIISAVYVNSGNLFFTWLWLALSFMAYIRRRSLIVKIMETSE